MRPTLTPVKSFIARPKRTFLFASVFIIVVLYWRSFTSPFVYDDLDQVVNNPNLASWNFFVQRFLLHPVTLTTSFLGQGGSTYRPLFWLSLFMDHAIWGLNAGGFHATNIALHLVNGNLVFALLRRLKLSVLPAAAVSLLWLTLPINTEVVAWVSGRAYELSTLFIILCLLSALRSMRTRGIVSGVACFITCACAVLSHELGIVLLPLLLLIALREPATWSRKLLAMPALILLATLCVEALRFMVGVKTFVGLASIRWASLALWQYVQLALFPLHMSVERSTSVSLAEPHRGLVFEVAGIVLVFAYAAIHRRKFPDLFGGLMWFGICIAPFVVLLNYQGLAERYLYLASIGIVLAIVAACEIIPASRFRYGPMMLVGFWCLWNAHRTIVRVADWSNPVRLYESSLEATPLSPAVHYNLAFSLRQRGDLSRALAEYQRTIELNRTYPHAFASLGDLYLQLNMFATAQVAYKRALAENPRDLAVLLNIGAAYQGAGAFPDAEAAYQSVLRLDPEDSAAHVDMGVLYSSEQRWNDASHQFAIAIDLKSKDPTPYYNLAVLLQRAGRRDLALVLYKKALKLNPSDPDTLRNIQAIEQNR